MFLGQKRFIVPTRIQLLDKRIKIFLILIKKLIFFKKNKKHVSFYPFIHNVNSTSVLYFFRRNNMGYDREEGIEYRILEFYSFLFFVLEVNEMLESQFQSKLIKELEKRFPGCIVMKNDACYRQGFPDLLVLYKNHWAALECKRSSKASHQPNQDYYISLLSNMSFASFISPENKEDVLNEIQRSFRD